MTVASPDAPANDSVEGVANDSLVRRDDLRNIAIIAHVDHGKTTLVDALLKQSGHFRDSELAQSCMLDSNELERERGITILAKNIALPWKGAKINIIDTPGHADFGGEVERVLKMADGVLILVDAFEGPRPQTRFVMTKALELGLKPVIVINKIDRPNARPDDVYMETVDLIHELGAEDALEIPYIYASGFQGYATHDIDNPGDSMSPLLDMVLEHIPGPLVDEESPFQMMVTTLEYSAFVGRIMIGRINSGRVKTGQKVMVMMDGSQKAATVEQVEMFDKLGRSKATEAAAGDIVALVGLGIASIGDTIADLDRPVALPRLSVDEPTLSMTFTVNTSPLAGRGSDGVDGGKFLTSRHLRDRLQRELQSNVALRVSDTESKEVFRVSGRGLLHLSILIETMRREGYELSVGKPEVIFKEIDGKRSEPYELLSVDVPAQHVGAVMELTQQRRGQCSEMAPNDTGMTHLEFSIPARGLIGLRTRLLNATKGEAVINHRFDEYRRVEGEIPGRKNGVLVSQISGKATAYALWKLGERSEHFIAPQKEVYEGMIVGENSRDNDLVVNPVREKKLTNVRSSGADDAIVLAPPRQMSLEVALEYIERDEWVEVTPGAIRLRKIFLTETERKRNPIR